MIKKLSRPTNDYDVAAWEAFYAQNPGYGRSVGAEATGGDGGSGGDDGSSGGAGGDDIDAKITAAVQAATAGLQAKNQELLNKNKELSNVAKKIEGVDVDGLLGLKEKIEQDEILKLLAEGKSQEALERQTEKLKVTYQAQLDNANNELNNYKTKAEQAEATVTKLIVDGEVTRAFAAEKGLPEASDDVLWRASKIFKAENGEPIARDSNGNIIQGEKGPLTIGEWINSLKKSAPHLFPRSAGGDLPGGAGQGGLSNEQRLIDAAKKGPAALREERARQAAAKAGK